MKKLLLISIILLACQSKQANQALISPDNTKEITPESLIPTQFPLKDYRVLQPFANFNNSFSRYHTAEDVEGKAGTPVYAIADGEISFSNIASGYGWLITIDHSELNVYSLYGHLSTRREKTKLGKVKKGELIAYLADDDEDGSGGAYPDWSPHLHFSIRKGSRRNYPGDASDNRFTAGYTHAHPTNLGWLEPTDFINARLE